MHYILPLNIQKSFQTLIFILWPSVYCNITWSRLFCEFISYLFRHFCMILLCQTRTPLSFHFYTSCHNPPSGCLLFPKFLHCVPLSERADPTMTLPVVIRVAEEVQEPYRSAAASCSFSSVQSGAYTNDKIISLREGVVMFM